VEAYRSGYKSFKVAQNSNISLRRRGFTAITRSPGGSRDLKFAKIKTHMAARGQLRKTLFPPSLVSCLRYQLFLPTKTFIPRAISKEKHSF